MTTELEARREELSERDRAINHEMTALYAEKREIAEQLDKLNMTTRPEYPTQEQRDGIKEAARRVHARTASDSHLGDPTPTYAVKADGAKGWLSIQHGAPYRARAGVRLWHFTDEEVAALIDLVEAEELTLIEHWMHSEGISIRVQKADSDE